MPRSSLFFKTSRDGVTSISAELVNDGTIFKAGNSLLNNVENLIIYPKVPTEVAWMSAGIALIVLCSAMKKNCEIIKPC